MANPEEPVVQKKRGGGTTQKGKGDKGPTETKTTEPKTPETSGSVPSGVNQESTSMQPKTSESVNTPRTNTTSSPGSAPAPLAPTQTTSPVLSNQTTQLRVFDKLQNYFSNVLAQIGGGYRNVREWFLSLSPKQRWAVLTGAAAALGLTYYSVAAYLRDDEGVPEKSIPRGGVGREKKDEDDEDIRTPNIYDPKDDSLFDEDYQYDRRGGCAKVICCEKCLHQDARTTDFIKVGNAHIDFEVLIRPVMRTRDSSTSKRDLF